jgi:uracil-DNA glycosylase
MGCVLSSVKYTQFYLNEQITLQMTITIDIADIKAKLSERLRVSGWEEKLKGFIYSPAFDAILDGLVTGREKGERFTPGLKQAFSAFEHCRYKDLKVVLLAGGPYPGLSVADGLAFSCSNTGVMEPALKHLLDAVRETVYPGSKYSYNPDLKRWAGQGILLLNTALTTVVDGPGKHFDLWGPFTSYVTDVLNGAPPGLIRIFAGKKARQWNEHINQNHYIVNVSHPDWSYKAGNNSWDCGDLFNEVNETLARNNQAPVTW